VKWQKRGFKAVDDDAVDVLLVESHLGVTEPELPRHRGARDETVVGIDRHSQTEVVIELEGMGS
jgi:hypothetical protein